MRPLLLLLASLAFSVHAASGLVLSGGVYNPATGHTYFLLGSDTWTGSEASASSMGGHLVTVNDAAENTWLVSTFSNFGGQTRALWTGLNDRQTEGDFLWTSGETATYRNWEAFQPDNGGGYYASEEYVLIWPDPGPRSPGQWNDYIDSATFPDMDFAVYGVVEIPEPATATFTLTFTALAFALKRRTQASSQDKMFSTRPGHVSFPCD